MKKTTKVELKQEVKKLSESKRVRKVPKWLIGLAEIVMTVIIKRATPFIRLFLKDSMEELERRAGLTANKIDDMLVEAVKGIFKALWE